MEEIRYKGLDIERVFDRCGDPSPSFVDANFSSSPPAPWGIEAGFPCDLNVGHEGSHKPYNWGGRFSTPPNTPVGNNARKNERPPDKFWVEYPIRPDANLRKALYWSEQDTTIEGDKGVMSHPAKAPIQQMEDIIRLVSKPGELVMDIFGGTGSTMIGARENRNILLLELEPPFHLLQQQSEEKMRKMGYIADSTKVFLQMGDNRELLKAYKGTIDHAMFSPPYSNTLAFSVKKESTAHLGGSTYVSEGDSTFGDYTTDKRSLGILPDFRFRMAMRGVYKQVYESLKPGGTMTTIMGDNMKQGKRLMLSDNVLKACKLAGFEDPTWLHRFMGGTGFKKDWMKKGLQVVLNEDVMIFRKPK